VLDDGKDPKLEKAIKDLSLEYLNLYYYARIKVKGVLHHFKARNLTGGTDFVMKLDSGESEFVTALDADIIPEPEWLCAIIAHLVIELEVALVCHLQVSDKAPGLLSLFLLTFY